MISEIQQQIKVYQDNLIFSINLEDKTASVIGINETKVKIIIIPNFINYQSSEYIVISISEEAFDSSKIEIVNFLPDSKIQTIEKSAFSKSSIVSFTVPPHLKKICSYAFYYCEKLVSFIIPPNSELQTIEDTVFEGTLITSLFLPSCLIDLQTRWIESAWNLTKIEISPSNPVYSTIDNKIIIKKSSNESENFDCIDSCTMDIMNVKIPNFIKIIGEYAFFEHDLFSVEFEANSQLQTIEKYAFSITKISTISIPCHLTKICQYAFFNCRSLCSIEIPQNSELQSIENEAFSGTSIGRFFIPSKVVDLGEKSFSGMFQLNSIIVSPNNQRYSCIDEKLLIEKSSIENIVYDNIVFAVRSIEEIAIPSFIKHIGGYSFSLCRNLQKVEISSDSELLTIGDKAFEYTSIKNFKCPPHLTKIGNSAFYLCHSLQSFEIPADSELQVIGLCAFADTKIEEFFIPPHLTQICSYAFSSSKLRKIEIPSNSNLQNVGENAFKSTYIESFTIPSKLNELGSGWCSYTENLKEVIISPNNQNFKSIDDDKMILKKSSNDTEIFDVLVFCKKDVEAVTIPSFIKHIGSFAFYNCTKLRTVDILNNSELQTIEDGAFLYTEIEIFTIPYNLTKIGDGAFYKCTKLRKIEIPSNSKIDTIGFSAFDGSLIKSFSLPPKVTKIDCISVNKNIQIIEFNENSEIDLIDYEMFRSIRKALIMIPEELIDRINPINH